MSIEIKKEVQLEIAHALFIDIDNFLKARILAEGICGRRQMNRGNFFSKLKRRIDPAGNPIRQDPCFQPLLTKYGVSMSGSSL